MTTPHHAPRSRSSSPPTPSLSTTSPPSPPPATSPIDPLATSIKTLLDPSIASTTSALSSVFLAQQELGAEIERLVIQLQHYLNTTDPPALRGTVVKLASTTRRLEKVNATLETLQTRINKIYAELSRQRLPNHSGPSSGGRRGRTYQHGG